MTNESSPSPKNRRLLVFGLLVVSITSLLIVRFLVGDSPNAEVDLSLTAVPAGSLAVAHFDRTTADLTQLISLWQTFTTATSDFDPPLNTPFQTIPAWLQAHNISLADDVLPWLGQTVSLALLSLSDDGPTAEWILVADSTDEVMTDAFVAKLAATSLSVARANHLIIIGSSETAVQQAITVQKNQSISDNTTYQSAIASLPADHPFTIYVAGNQMEPLVETVWAQTAVSNTLPFPQFLNMNSLRSLAIAITASEAGLQIDTTTLYDPAQLSLIQQTALNTWLEKPQTDKIAPENSLFYLNGAGLNLLWQMYADSPAQADSREAMQLLGEQFGFNPNKDLFPFLDGETAVILSPSRSGTATQLLRLNLGGTLLVSTSKPDTLSANLTGFTTAISDPQLGIATVQETAVHNIPLTQLQTGLIPGLSLVYGVGQGYLLLSSSTDSLSELNFGNGRSLADNPDYQIAKAALPAGKKPTLFVNVTELVEIFRTSGFMLAQAREFARHTAVLQPIHLITASSSASETTTQNRIILFVKTDD